ncbi:MAG TPA: PA0069 family radical SAM protein [Gammaproteobacteria bacterium]|nr:PA0069 family radical SAM protein [Gammaproteobacteria bacterium]
MNGKEGGAIRGRGSAARPEGRFESLAHEREDDGWFPPEEEGRPRTTLGVDRARRVLSDNDSPDVGFSRSINPYKGCEHGCAYCFARPTHSYLGLSPGLDFETKIFYKPDAPEQLARELAAPNYRSTPIALGINTDAYQPIERETRLTRRILEVLAAHAHPLTIVTKSALVERDLDLLAPMAARGLASVAFSITTLDRELARRMEPRATAPARRIEAVRRVAAAGVPVSVLVAPVIPALNDMELERVLECAREAGAEHAGYVVLRLPHELAELFPAWLEAHYPERKGKVLSILTELHGGKLYDSRFGTRMRGQGEWGSLLAQRFALARRRLGYSEKWASLRSDLFRVPGRAEQLGLAL